MPDTELKEELNEEELDELNELDPEELESADEEELIFYTFTQKLILWIGGILFFIFFVILLFPYQDITKVILAKTMGESGTSIDFRDFDLSLFGKTRIDHLSIDTNSGVSLSSEETNIDLSLLSFYKNRLIGELETLSLNFLWKNIELKFGSALINLDLNDIHKDWIAGIHGKMNLEAFQGKIIKSPPIPKVNIDLSGINIKSLIVSTKKSGTTLLIERAFLKTSVGNISIKGKLIFRPRFENTGLNINICLNLDKEFVDNSDALFNLMNIIPRQSDGKSCLPIKGTFSNPRPQLPNM